VLLARGDVVEALLYRNGMRGKREKRDAGRKVRSGMRIRQDKKEGTVLTVPSSFPAVPVGLTP
jgi:hypothetical protein